jgi:transposase
VYDPRGLQAMLRLREEQPMRIAIEAGTHSHWVSRVLEECGHEVLVANARKLRLIYANKRKTDEIDAEKHPRAANCRTRVSPPGLEDPLSFPTALATAQPSADPSLL